MRKILLLAALLAASPALAQQEAPPPPPDQAAPPAPAHKGHRHRFDDANVTHDGKLTLDQAQAGHWQMVVRHFAEIDRDHKGYVTKQDLKDFRQQRHAARGAPPPPPAAPNAPPPADAPGHY